MKKMILGLALRSREIGKIKSGSYSLKNAFLDLKKGVWIKNLFFENSKTGLLVTKRQIKDLEGKSLELLWLRREGRFFKLMLQVHEAKPSRRSTRRRKIKDLEQWDLS